MAVDRSRETPLTRFGPVGSIYILADGTRVRSIAEPLYLQVKCRADDGSEHVVYYESLRDGLVKRYGGVSIVCRVVDRIELSPHEAIDTAPYIGWYVVEDSENTLELTESFWADQPHSVHFNVKNCSYSLEWHTEERDANGPTFDTNSIEVGFDHKCTNAGGKRGSD